MVYNNIIKGLYKLYLGDPKYKKIIILLFITVINIYYNNFVLYYVVLRYTCFPKLLRVFEIGH